MHQQLIDGDLSIARYVKLRQQISDRFSWVDLTGLDKHRREQPCDQRFGKTREIIDRIQFRFNTFGLDNCISKRVLKKYLAFIRDQISGRRKIVGFDALLEE